MALPLSYTANSGRNELVKQDGMKYTGPSGSQLHVAAQEADSVVCRQTKINGTKTAHITSTNHYTCIRKVLCDDGFSTKSNVVSEDIS